MKYILVIAVGQYDDLKFGKVAFAAEDGHAIATAFKMLGYDVTVLTDSGATVTAVASELRRIARAAGVDDEVIVYFAGHGICEEAKTRLVLRDSRYLDRKETTFPVQEILDVLRSNGCRKFVLFLDACHAGLLIDPSMRSPVSGISDEVLREEMETAEYGFAFASCKADEKSYSSLSLKHGIWTHHLLEALNGKVAEVLDGAGNIVAARLQSYLSRSVKKTISETFSDKRTQTPWHFGGATTPNFAVVSIAPILKKKREAVVTEFPADAVRFLKRERIDIKDLNGFVRGVHFVPDNRSMWTEGFVHEVGEGDVRERLSDWHKAIRDSFDVKKEDLKKSSVTMGGGTIEIPGFGLEVQVEQSRDDHGEAVITTTLSKVECADSDEWEDIDEFFSRDFTIAELSAEADVDGVIKYLQEHEELGIRVSDYDVDDDDNAQFCELESKKFKGTVRIDSDTISVRAGASGTPGELLKALEQAVQVLAPLVEQELLTIAE